MSNQERIGEFVQTYSGKAFYPLDPRPEDINIEDIAHALSMQCRFNGHCRVFYSVAEHCWHVANAASQHNKLWALLHDAEEAYTSDIPRPLKRMLNDVMGWDYYEAKIRTAICNKFRLRPSTLPNEIKWLDMRMLHSEKLQIMKPSEKEWGELPEPIDTLIFGWEPRRAKEKFLEMFYDLMKLRTRDNDPA